MYAKRALEDLRARALAKEQVLSPARLHTSDCILMLPASHIQRDEDLWMAGTGIATNMVDIV